MHMFSLLSEPKSSVPLKEMHLPHLVILACYSHHPYASKQACASMWGVEFRKFIGIKTNL